MVIIVYARKNQDIWTNVLNDVDDACDLVIFSPLDIAKQKPRAIACQFGIEECDSKSVLGGCLKRAQESYAGSKSPCSAALVSRRFAVIIFAIRPIAIPRRKREAGRNAHAATVQINV